MLFADVRHYHATATSGTSATPASTRPGSPARSADPAENLRQVAALPGRQFYFPAGGASVHHLAAPATFTFARLTRGDGRYRMHVLDGRRRALRRRGERGAGASRRPDRGRTAFARLRRRPTRCSWAPTPPTTSTPCPGDWRAELRVVCRLLDIDCVELVGARGLRWRSASTSARRRRRACWSTRTGGSSPAPAPSTASTSRSPGYAEHDAETVWWDDTVRSRSASSPANGPAEPAAVCVSGIGPCALVADAERPPAAPGHPLRDRLAGGPEIDELNDELGRGADPRASAGPR